MLGGFFFEGDENAATLFTQHTSLLAHKNAVQHGSDLVCSSKDRLCAVVVVVVGIGGRRSTRAHTQRRSRHAQTERERERERERKRREFIGRRRRRQSLISIKVFGRRFLIERGGGVHFF